MTDPHKKYLKWKCKKIIFRLKVIRQEVSKKERGNTK